MKKHLVEPPVKRIDLHFPLGLEVTARNLKGVTIKDALDAIYKQFKKKVRNQSSPPSTFRSFRNVWIDDQPYPQLCDLFADCYNFQADDELGENPILAGFEWDKEESWTRLIVHQKKEGQMPQSKKSKKNKDEA